MRSTFLLVHNLPINPTKVTFAHPQVYLFRLGRLQCCSRSRKITNNLSSPCPLTTRRNKRLKLEEGPSEGMRGGEREESGEQSEKKTQRKTNVGLAPPHPASHLFGLAT